jgi:hypothetical protein
LREGDEDAGLLTGSNGAEVGPALGVQTGGFDKDVSSMLGVLVDLRLLSDMTP